MFQIMKKFQLLSGFDILICVNMGINLVLFLSILSGHQMLHL